jgi:hypothetical protein
MTGIAGAERRSRIRFLIVLKAAYAVPKRPAIAGVGTTVNISSQGVLLTADHEIPCGTVLKLRIDWPVHLNQVRPLSLHVGGTVVRSGQGQVAVLIRKYELRTRPGSNGSNVLRSTGRIN